MKSLEKRDIIGLIEYIFDWIESVKKKWKGEKNDE